MVSLRGIFCKQIMQKSSSSDDDPFCGDDCFFARFGDGVAGDIAFFGVVFFCAAFFGVAFFCAAFFGDRCFEWARFFPFLSLLQYFLVRLKLCSALIFDLVLLSFSVSPVAMDQYQTALKLSWRPETVMLMALMAFKRSSSEIVEISPNC